MSNIKRKFNESDDNESAKQKPKVEEEKKLSKTLEQDDIYRRLVACLSDETANEVNIGLPVLDLLSIVASYATRWVTTLLRNPYLSSTAEGVTTCLRGVAEYSDDSIALLTDYGHVSRIYNLNSGSTTLMHKWSSICDHISICGDPNQAGRFYYARVISRTFAEHVQRSQILEVDVYENGKVSRFIQKDMYRSELPRGLGLTFSQKGLFWVHSQSAVYRLLPDAAVQSFGLSYGIYEESHVTASRHPKDKHLDAFFLIVCRNELNRFDHTATKEFRPLRKFSRNVEGMVCTPSGHVIVAMRSAPNTCSIQFYYLDPYSCHPNDIWLLAGRDANTDVTDGHPTDEAVFTQINHLAVHTGTRCLIVVNSSSVRSIPLAPRFFVPL